MFSILHTCWLIWNTSVLLHSSCVSINRYYIPVYLCIIGLFIVYSYIFITIRRQVSWYHIARISNPGLVWLADLIILFHCVWLPNPFFKIAHKSITTSTIFCFHPSFPPQRSKGQGSNPFPYMSISFLENAILSDTFHSIIQWSYYLTITVY